MRLFLVGLQKIPHMENSSSSYSGNKPESPESMQDWEKYHHIRRRRGGLIIFVTGMFLLLQQLHLPIPAWILSWPMYLVILGIVFLLSSRCHSGLGIIFLLTGGIFLARDILDLPVEIYPYIWPVVIMLIGLILIFRPRSRKRFCYRDHCKNRYGWYHSSATQQPNSSSGEATDWFDTTAVFCGIRRKIISKHFKGGDVVSCFGGVEIDLTQADVQGNAIIDASVVFGGLRLFVPTSWDVRVNMTNVMGGVDDRREVAGIMPDPNKTLTLTGAVVMGGVEIRSFPT
ncbi:LiaF transmembrane domain-containing protein [Thermoflavifilum thermophilum]|uniref:Predicted membrane protein n=1 Tax=Thermoflavifilum thermophilum TaxID=1393122 RepID=A0A1I7MXT8_9BACT|nr:LiaF domain-containing protein [Thermoflavifilum thermophilum]SFV27249.1 Predicted membrane protein [Thermoflavifilum thermophilum]